MVNLNLSRNINLINTNLIIINSAFLVKIGIAPFHFWFPEIIYGLNWINSIIILTWQKIAPIVLFIFNITNNTFTIFIIIVSAIIRRVSRLNIINLKKILAFSSINHIRWIMRIIVFRKIIWIIYFFIYTISTIILILFINKFKILFINQIAILNNKKEIIIFFLLGFVSFIGLPPTVGFISKWLTIQVLIWENWLFLTVILIILTTLIIFIYFQLIISALLFNSKKNNFFSPNKIIFSNLTIINLFNILGIIIITLIFNF